MPWPRAEGSDVEDEVLLTLGLDITHCGSTRCQRRQRCGAQRERCSQTVKKCRETPSARPSSGTDRKVAIASTSSSSPSTRARAAENAMGESEPAWAEPLFCAMLSGCDRTSPLLSPGPFVFSPGRNRLSPGPFPQRCPLASSRAGHSRTRTLTHSRISLALYRLRVPLGEGVK